MKSLTISEMWADLVKFDHTIRAVYYMNLRKTAVESDTFTYALEDHIDKAIYEAWHVLQRTQQ